MAQVRVRAELLLREYHMHVWCWEVNLHSQALNCYAKKVSFYGAIGCKIRKSHNDFSIHGVPNLSPLLNTLASWAWFGNIRIYSSMPMEYSIWNFKYLILACQTVCHVDADLLLITAESSNCIFLQLRLLFHMWPAASFAWQALEPLELLIGNALVIFN